MKDIPRLRCSLGLAVLPLLAIVGIILRLTTIALLAVSLLRGIALLLRVALLWWVALLRIALLRIALLGRVALVVASLVVLVVRAGHSRECSIEVDLVVCGCSWDRSSFVKTSKGGV